MRSHFTSDTIATISLLLLCFYATVGADWCKFTQRETCNCFYSEIIQINSIVCTYPTSQTDLADSLKRLLVAKNDTTPIHLALHETYRLFALPENLFDGAVIEKIEMTDVDLPFLEPEPESETSLNALSGSLQEMVFVRVRYLQNWRWSKVHLEKVHTFRAEGCFFPIIPKDFSSAFPNIKELVIRNSEVFFIKPEALAFVNRKIESIVIEGNNISSLSRESFRRENWTKDKSLENLVTMNMRNNNIATISDDFLEGMEQLQHFNISDNDITSLGKDFFQPCAKEEWSCALKDFYSGGNPFDYSTCKLLIDLHKRFKNHVDIPISYRCVELLDLDSKDLK